jgi:hypothetical protein
MTEPVAREFSSQVGKRGPSFKLGSISELQMVRDPGGRERGWQHLKDPSVVLRAISPFGDTEVQPDPEVCGHPRLLWVREMLHLRRLDSEDFIRTRRDCSKSLALNGEPAQRSQV